MRVHITLAETVRKNADRKQHALTVLQEVGRLVNVDLKRFARYGVISADISPALMKQAEGVPGVQSIAPDSQQRAI